MRPLSHGEYINALQAIRSRTDLSERERALRTNQLREQMRANEPNDRANESGAYGARSYRSTQAQSEGGTPVYQKSQEIRVPHILIVALFWSIVMMFVAENLIP